MKKFDKIGLLTSNEFLLAKVRIYVEQRFHLMDRQMLLDYLAFLDYLGMLADDKGMFLLITNNFERNYYLYEIPQLCQLFKILSHCHYSLPKVVELIEDSLKIRMNDRKQRESIKPIHILDLIEGLILFESFNKKLDVILNKLLKDENLLYLDKELVVQAIMYNANY
jgi:hypothetical protein